MKIRLKQITRVLRLFLLTAIFCSLLFSQQNQTSQKISFLFSGGAAWSGTNKWYLPYVVTDPQAAQVKPGIASSFGVEMGPVVDISGMLINSSIEISYGEENYEKIHPVSSYSSGIQRTSIIVWSKFISATQLSPFLRLGVGTTKTDFRLKFENNVRVNIRFHEWNTCLAIGGGFHYSLNEAFRIELFVDDYITFSEITRYNQDGGYTAGIFNPFGLISTGLRFQYYL